MDTNAKHQTFQTRQFVRLKSYPFSRDTEFANGLSIILGHPGTPASEAEVSRDDDLVLQAKCFYFSRKEDLSPPLDFAAYKTWLASASQGQGPLSQDAQPSPSDPAAASNSHAKEPTYPSSFAHIVELITTGQPIPGIQQIPDTVLKGHDKSSAKPKRLKPWEKGCGDMN